MVELGPHEYVVLINLIVDGRDMGQVPIVYLIPPELAEDERAAFARERVAEITAAINEQGQHLVKEMDPHARMELVFNEKGDLAWLGKAPDDARELD